MEITVIELAFYALKEEAIRRHRLMWNWIADEAERTHKPVTKMDALRAKSMILPSMRVRSIR